MRGKRSSPAVAGKPAAKRGKAGSGTAAAGGSKPGGGSGGKAITGKPQAGKRAATGSSTLYVIRCERKTAVEDWDEDFFVEYNSDEVEEQRDQVESCAQKGDGVTYFSIAGGLAVFESLEAANRQAALVSRDMLRLCPLYWRTAEGSEEGEEEGGSGEDDGEGEAEAAGVPSKVLSGGRHRYEGEGFFFVDLWDSNLENLCRTRTVVEVAPAVLVTAA